MLHFKLPTSTVYHHLLEVLKARLVPWETTCENTQYRMSNKSKLWVYWINQERDKRLRRVISCSKRIHAWLEEGCLLAIRRTVIQRQEQSLHSHSWGKLYHKAILGRQAKIFRVDCAPWISSCLGLLWVIFFFSSKSLKYSENHIWVYHSSDFTGWWHSYLLQATAMCHWSIVWVCSVAGGCESQSKSSLTHGMYRVVEGESNTQNCNQIQTQRKPIASSKEQTCNEVIYTTFQNGISLQN